MLIKRCWSVKLVSREEKEEKKGVINVRTKWVKKRKQASEKKTKGNAKRRKQKEGKGKQGKVEKIKRKKGVKIGSRSKWGKRIKIVSWKTEKYESR